MTTNTFIIKFKDGTTKTIKGASGMDINVEQNCFRLTKNGYIIFIPRENVKFIGREFDLSEEAAEEALKGSETR
jgi:hypothetical protein